MWVKVLTTALSSLSIKQDPVELVTLTVRREISALVLKLLLSLTLTAAIIFSMIQSGSALRSLLGSSENGTLVQFIIFGVLTIAGLGTLVFMFNRKSKATVDPIVPSTGLEELVITFVQGFLEGLNSADSPGSKKNRSQDSHPQP